jgi:AAA15 family ATPase/GTPase
MIINFSIKNFRSIKDEITLTFEANKSDDLEDFYIFRPKENMRLLKIAIIYGANASGKTNVLLALNLLRSLVLKPKNKKTDVLDFEPFLFDEETIKRNTTFTIEFIQDQIKYLYEIEFNHSAVLREMLYFYNPNKALIYKRTTDIKNQLAQITFGPKIKLNKESKTTLVGNTLWNNTVLGGFVKSNVQSHELQAVIHWFDNYLKPIIEPRTKLIPFVSNLIEKEKIKKNLLIEILHKADFGISDIEIKNEAIPIDEERLLMINKTGSLDLDKEEFEKFKNNRSLEIKETYFQHTINHKKYILPIAMESAGTQRYYELGGILSFILSKESVLPIDELESSLHPDLIKHFLLTFLVNAHGSQIIATTHHRELLMEKDILRNDAIWFTERKEDGSTDLYSLADFKSSVIRNTSSIYNAYKIGKLGAVPNLKDFYLGLEYEKK